MFLSLSSSRQVIGLLKDVVSNIGAALVALSLGPFPPAPLTACVVVMFGRMKIINITLDKQLTLK
jgi:hypothetical protein